LRWRGTGILATRESVEHVIGREIYITRQGRRDGLYSLEEVNHQLAVGRLSPIDQAWSEGSPGWKPVLGFPGVIIPGGASSTTAQLGTARIAATSLVRYAGFWIRALAFAVDVGILAFPVGFVLVLAGFRAGEPTEGNRLIGLTISLLLALIYFAAFWCSKGQATPGQRLCGLRVVDSITQGRVSFGRAVARCLALWMGLGALLAGVLMVALNDRKRGWHDLIAGSNVVKTS
jgi:uncharacterized RDD family membrane protein YckC